MEWNPINLEPEEKYTLAMEFPDCEPYQTCTKEVLVCYTTKDWAHRPATKKYSIGWFDHDGDNWYCQLAYGNKDKVEDYLAWSYIDEYNPTP